jgi:hypothetical protein
MMDIIDEPITTQMHNDAENGRDFTQYRYRYLVTWGEDNKKECMCRSYADYVADAKNGKIFDLLLNKNVKHWKKRCDYCKKMGLSLCSGERGSFPKEEASYTCKFCYSVYDIKSVLCSENLLYIK